MFPIKPMPDMTHIARGPPHIPRGPSHIPRGADEWNMGWSELNMGWSEWNMRKIKRGDIHEWMSFVEWMEPSLILVICHVELSLASGISELYHDAKCSNQSRNSNFVPQKIDYFNPDGGQEQGK